MFWFILFIVSAAIVVATRPESIDPKSAGIEDFSGPTAEIGRSIAVLFGSKEIKGPNVVWYGDLKASAIKQKAGKK